jgi:hypothetical protein
MGKYHCTIDLLFDCFELVCFANENKNVVSSHTADSKPVKQEVNGTVISPPLVFPVFNFEIYFGTFFCQNIKLCIFSLFNRQKVIEILFLWSFLLQNAIAKNWVVILRLGSVAEGLGFFFRLARVEPRVVLLSGTGQRSHHCHQFCATKFFNEADTLESSSILIYSQLQMFIYKRGQ